MDPRRITEVFALHGNEMTWDSHLRVVEHLETLHVDELLDFQRTLIDRLATGEWIRTSVNRIITFPDGSSTDPRITLLDDEAIESLRSAGLDTAYFEKVNAAINSFVPLDVAPEVPTGWIGLPLHPWAGAPVAAVAMPSDTVKVRMARKAWEGAVSRVRGEFGWILRAAPWAFHRATGRRMEGVLPDLEEERWLAPGPPTAWAGRYVLNRGSDRVELFRLAMVVSADEASVHLFDYFSKLVRLLKATVTESEWVQVGGQFTPGTGWGDGQVVWARHQVHEHGESNPLLESLLEMTQTPKSYKPARLMAEKTFWSLIGILGGDAESNRWGEVAAALALKQPSAICSFAETLAAKLFALDRPDLLEYDSTGLGLSADVHLYLRCAIVAAGPEVYATALTHPVTEELLGSGAGEQLLSVATAAFEQRTGGPLEDETMVSYETGSNAEAWGRFDAIEGPFVAWTEHSVEPSSEGPVDSIRYWTTRVGDYAIERHRRSGHGGTILGAHGILRNDAMTLNVALAGVLFARSMPAQL
jgi:hypothetical protein